MSRLTPLLTLALAHATTGLVTEVLLSQRHSFGHSFQLLTLLPTLNTRPIHGVSIGVILIGIHAVAKEIFAGFLKYFKYQVRDQEADGHVAKVCLFISVVLTSMLGSKLFSVSRRDATILTVANLVANVLFDRLGKEFNRRIVADEGDKGQPARRYRRCNDSWSNLRREEEFYG